ncbi:FAD binding domain [Fusarium albosuccineum]|uniref:FAD binding domain n=1 Tax=Fusarium albosuccineum TaxID=1237068 RepID=A0A8H4JT07_9HYPO|nr:FAD binding domain [Fusarium albosuccineum]
MTLKLIIVGASITGLSLANMIEELSLDIEFVVLEAYPRIAPQVGASIGLLPNGLRILDQLGCYGRIRSIAGNFYLKTVMRNSQGHLLTESRGDSVSERLEERTGYPSLFIDRQMLLQVLYDNLKQKSRVIPGKRVIRADLDSDRARAHTEDGSTYEGDLVVGADGVHNIIRREMWRIASEVESNPFLPDEGLRMIFSLLY